MLSRAVLRQHYVLGRMQELGYITPQARYCAIRGGDYVVTREQTATSPEEGSCALPGAPAWGNFAEAWTLTDATAPIEMAPDLFFDGRGMLRRPRIDRPASIGRA